MAQQTPRHAALALLLLEIQQQPHYLPSTCTGSASACGTWVSHTHRANARISLAPASHVPPFHCCLCFWDLFLFLWSSFLVLGGLGAVPLLGLLLRLLARDRGPAVLDLLGGQGLSLEAVGRSRRLHGGGRSGLLRSGLGLLLGALLLGLAHGRPRSRCLLHRRLRRRLRRLGGLLGLLGSLCGRSGLGLGRLHRRSGLGRLLLRLGLLTLRRGRRRRRRTLRLGAASHGHAEQPRADHHGAQEDLRVGAAERLRQALRQLGHLRENHVHEPHGCA
mmetsp:Transcript_3659/g.10503  ORF Transcript_3659/g.10503 Transcript_3659/m.10503 type:complete len:276 (+) Transcript_3659:1361-2188(+)